MKRLLSIAGGVLGLLALGALAVILAFTFGGLRADVKPASQAFQSPIETPTQPPYLPPATPTPPAPPATPTVAPTPIPRCTFAARSAPAEPATPLETYHFSDPQVVLTHTGAVGIASWLPDSQHLFITQDIPNTNRNSIDIFNVRTGELITYAERVGNGGKPIWLPALRAMAYVTLVEEEHHEQRISYRPELWVSYGNSQQVERLALDALGLSLVAEPDGKHLWYFSRSDLNRPQQLNVETRTIQPAPLDLTSLRYLKPGLKWAMRDRSPTFRMVWQPDGSQIALYSQFWTFLLDTQTNQVCEFDLGEYISEAMDIPPWALETQWSPNGRYLAFITTGTLSAPFRRTELTILDMETGERRTLSPGLDIAPGRHYVTDMAWAPDSRYLAVLGTVRITETGSEKEGIFIVDVDQGESHQILSNYDFGGGLWGSQLAWDPSGSQLAVNCPTPEEGRLCIILVRPKGAQEEQP